MKPTIKRRWLIPTLLSLALPGAPMSPGVAHARQASDAPLPPIAPKELAARIREARNPYDDQGVFQATFDEVRDTNWKFARNQGNAEEQKPILVIFHGLVRFASNGMQWRAEHDGKAPNALSARLTPDHWISGFDGSRSYDWRVSDRRVILHETHDNPRLWTARNLFWEQADALIDALEQQGPARIPVAIRAEVVDGQACYVVEAGKAGEGLLTRHVLSPSRGYLPIRRVQQRDGKTFLTYDLHDLREVTPGIWAPGRIELEWLNVRKDGASRPFIRRSIRVGDYRPRGLVDPALLTFDLPYDAIVTDPRLGYTYLNDPWWPEIGPVLLSRFDWPKTDLSPLGKLALAPAKPLDNPSPPPVRFASWVQTRFPHFAALTDKVVLLVFDDGRSQTRLELAPALKRLDSAYHAAGLEIIAIAPPGVDVEELKQAVPAYEIKYAVAVDAPGPDGRGRTAAAFHVEQFPAAVVIDRQGKVRAPEGGRLVDMILTLLAQADGPQAIPRLSLEPPRLPQQAYRVRHKTLPAGSLPGPRRPSRRGDHLPGRRFAGTGRRRCEGVGPAEPHRPPDVGLECLLEHVLRRSAGDRRLDRSGRPGRHPQALQGDVHPEGRGSRQGLGRA